MDIKTIKSYKNYSLENSIFFRINLLNEIIADTNKIDWSTYFCELFDTSLYNIKEYFMTILDGNFYEITKKSYQERNVNISKVIWLMSLLKSTDPFVITTACWICENWNLWSDKITVNKLNAYKCSSGHKLLPQNISEFNDFNFVESFKSYLNAFELNELAKCKQCKHLITEYTEHEKYKNVEDGYIQENTLLFGAIPCEDEEPQMIKTYKQVSTNKFYVTAKCSICGCKLMKGDKDDEHWHISVYENVSKEKQRVIDNLNKA